MKDNTPSKNPNKLNRTDQLMKNNVQHKSTDLMKGVTVQRKSTDLLMKDNTASKK